ncbi:MAG: ammonium transporter [Candidatus Margulisbacteria bacterium]|nr:ammonium transporter [Candidatus Margulisiibacteriota bacterium]
MNRFFRLLTIVFIVLFAGFALGDDTVATDPKPYIDFGNTAWMLMSSALVLLMTAPGLALFYGGLVKRKNILSVLMQCFLTLALVTVFWVTIGYSLAFGPGKGVLGGFIGSLDWAMLRNVGMEPSPYYISQATARIPHLVFMLFQCMFAVITPALIIGAFAERMKFSTFMVFTFLWSLLIYAPIAHMVWSADGWLLKLGALDFAGGTVVHINAGMAALATALIIGKRRYLKGVPPHNLVFTMIGAALLWFGWFGFNAGSGLAADGLAASAFMVTHVATATAALMWALIDWVMHKRPTMLGAATGAVAGLVAITPASGFVDVTGALIIGAVVSIVCYFFVVVIKGFFKYDDALDAFGVHGIGGIWGAIATGLFATPLVQSAYKGFFYGNPHQLTIQLIAVGITMVYSFAGTLIIYKVLDLIMGVRVSETEEAMGLDITEHNERAYTVIE